MQTGGTDGIQELASCVSLMQLHGTVHVVFARAISRPLDVTRGDKDVFEQCVLFQILLLKGSDQTFHKFRYPNKDSSLIGGLDYLAIKGIWECLTIARS